MHCENYRFVIRKMQFIDDDVLLMNPFQLINMQENNVI